MHLPSYVSLAFKEGVFDEIMEYIGVENVPAVGVGTFVHISNLFRAATNYSSLDCSIVHIIFKSYSYKPNKMEPDGVAQ